MKAVVDAEGRIVIPPEIRTEAGLGPGAEVEVRVRNGIVELSPIELPVRLERRKYLLVAVPEVPVAPMTTDEVEAARGSAVTERADPHEIARYMPQV